MEIRTWAEQILASDSLEGKLFCPQTFTDAYPGIPVFWDEPTRPSGMSLGKRSKKDRLPRLDELHDPDKRAVCLHRFAGHELLAIELMAFALLAFPDAPSSFRKGVVYTLKEEQEHLRLYMKRLEALGLVFGDLPLYRHFWVHTKHMHTPLDYVSTVNLTLEMANLDFAPMYGQCFERFEDKDSADLMLRILKDEIAHVNFGWRWLNQLKTPGESPWESWCQHQSLYLTPKRAKGLVFNQEARFEAGISSSWVEALKRL